MMVMANTCARLASTHLSYMEPTDNPIRWILLWFPIHMWKTEAQRCLHSREAAETSLELGLSVIFAVAGEIQEGILRPPMLLCSPARAQCSNHWIGSVVHSQAGCGNSSFLTPSQAASLQFLIDYFCRDPQSSLLRDNFFLIMLSIWGLISGSPQSSVFYWPMSPALFLRCPASSLLPRVESLVLTRTSSLWATVQISPQTIRQLRPLGALGVERRGWEGVSKLEMRTEAQTWELLPTAAGPLWFPINLATSGQIYGLSRRDVRNHLLSFRCCMLWPPLWVYS